MKTEIPYTSPEFKTSSFNCPHCNAFSSMDWQAAFLGYMGRNPISNLNCAQCNHCDQYSLWVGDKMIFPSQFNIDLPNKDLPEDIVEDYIEAAEILNLSPRGSAALLRLAIEKLINSLEEDGNDLNSKIGLLVKKGLSIKIQQALDILRVVGNNAVHPGQINLKDNSKIARSLFQLVNIIGDEMITKPKDVSNLFEDLVPEKQKEGIVKRDSK